MVVTPIVSVVIPAYNREGTIGAALQGAMAQTLEDLEVVVVDDGSSDSTAAVVEACPDPRVRLIRHPTNRGGNAARLTGIAASSAPFVAFLDSDDRWEPDKLERQVRRLEEAGERYGLCYCWFDIETPTGCLPPPLTATAEGVAIPELLTRNIIGTYSVAMLRRSALEEVAGPDPTLPSCQDWDLYLRVNERWGICVVPAVLAHYRRDDADPHRISGRSTSMIVGHRRLYRRLREKYAAMPTASVLQSQNVFLDAFAQAGAPIDALRVARDVPRKAWTAQAATRIGRQVARAARNRARRPS